MTSIHEASAATLAGLVKKGELSPVEIGGSRSCRDRKGQHPPERVRCVAGGQGNRRRKRPLEERIAGGEEPGPLCGVPFGVKDLEDTEGLVTSFGSVPFKHNIALTDSVQVARLKAAGAIVLGKTNTPEFGFTGFTKNRLYGVTRNPWNLERTPGGSSGGSAAAVAGRLVPFATGSDAGGSIRIPSCYSGIFGLKTTRGRIPMGPLPYLSMHQLAVYGPMTRTVEDAAIYLDCTSGSHHSDPAAFPKPERSYADILDEVPKGLKIAFSADLGYAKVQRDVMARVFDAVRTFEQMGHTVETWEGKIKDPGDTWAMLINCDLYATLQPVLEQFRNDLGRTLVLAMDHTSTIPMEQFIWGQRVRTELCRTFGALFEEYDLLMTPAMPTEAFDAKGPPPSEIEGEPVPLLGPVAFTYPFNITGHPAATVPIGFTDAGLPAGLQIVAPHYREDLVLQAARAYEQANPWDKNWPDLE